MRIWTRWHGWRAASTLFFNLLYYLFTNDFHRCNNQQVECMRAAGAWGKTCKVCLEAKQRCDASWGEVVAGNSGFSTFGPTGLVLLERLVAGVEKMGTELVKINKKLGMIARGRDRRSR